MLYLDGQLGLVDDMLHYFDRASMARSLEVRVPFLDHDFVEFCARIPTDLKVRGLHDEVPAQARGRGHRPGPDHRQAQDRLLQRRRRRLVRARRRDGAISRLPARAEPGYAELLDRGRVERLVARARGGRQVQPRHALLSLLMLEVWLWEFLPRALRRASLRGRNRGRA